MTAPPVTAAAAATSFWSQPSMATTLLVLLLASKLETGSPARIRVRKPAKKRCGVNKASPAADTMRIVGGQPSARGEWPWQVVITQKYRRRGRGARILCSGTLIHPLWVLTAAHCIVDPLFHLVLPAKAWRVRAGETTLGERPDHVLRVSELVPHPWFNESTWHHDIALVRLAGPVNLTDAPALNTICLADTDAFIDADSCCVTGWGQTATGTIPRTHVDPRLRRLVLSLVLQKASAPLVSRQQCQKAYSHVLTEGMVCAGNAQGLAGPCIGDSGGPLQCQARDGRWFQVGVASWGAGCGQQAFPAVYTRPAAYMDWIRATMRRKWNPDMIGEDYNSTENGIE